MGYNEASQKATYKYRNEELDRIEVYFPKGEKENIEKCAKKCGKSRNNFIVEAVKEKMERDG